jgi:conjugative transfer region protein TrbK
MRARVIAAAVLVLSFAGSVPISAQSVDDLLKDHALLRSELDRCKQMGLASNDDARCKTARAAEQKRFFGNGVGYTSKPTNVFPGTPDYAAPGQGNTSATTPNASGSLNGQ